MKATDHEGPREATPTTEASGRASAAIVVLAEPVHAMSRPAAAADFLGRDHRAGWDGPEICESIASSCGDSEGCAGETACPSPLYSDARADLIHELSNLVTGVLLNAQVLEWKLPPYSHLKRPVREVARSAQRGSELLKRLVRCCAEADQPGQPQYSTGCGKAPPGWEAARATAGCEIAARARPQTAGDLTLDCDSRTSHAFPKRDDRDGQ